MVIPVAITKLATQKKLNPNRNFTQKPAFV
jgi:hypothetical protein